MRLRHVTRLAWALLPLLLGVAGSARGQGKAAELSPGFVQVQLNAEPPIPFVEVVLDDAEQPYVLFSRMVSLLELPIRYDPGLRAAVGRLPDDSHFTLNAERLLVEVGEHKHELPPDAVRVVAGKLYILWSEYPRWLPIRARWSLVAYELALTTGYPLPSAERRRRAQLREQTMARRLVGEAPVMAREVPWFDPGMFEFRGSGVASRDADPAGTLNLTGVQRFLTGDLEYSATAPVGDTTGRKPDLDYLRLKFYDSAREHEGIIGDTFTTFSPLVLPFASVRGAAFFTGGQRLRYGRTQLVGTAPLGSEVELYRGGVFMGFSPVDARGFYRFDNVPLGQSETLFEVRIYTPDGRRLVEFQAVSSQEEMLDQGGWASQGGIGRSNLKENPYDAAGAEVRYGILPGLTGGVYAVGVRDYKVVETETLARMSAYGAFAYWRPIPWLLLLGERAADAELPGQALRFDGFLSFPWGALEYDRRTYAGAFAPPARRRATEFGDTALLRTANDLILRARPLLTNVTLTGRGWAYDGARASSEAELRMDRRLWRNLTASVTVDRLRFLAGSAEVGGADSVQLLSAYGFDALNRAELTYNHTRPTGSLVATTDSGTLTYTKNYAPGSPWSYRASYTSESAGTGLTEVAFGYLFASNFRINAQLDSKGAWRVQLDYSVPFQVTGQGVNVLPPNTFGRAGIEGTVFVDENGDGVRGPNERAVPGVRINAPGVANLVSDRNGRFSGWGVPSGSPVELNLDLLTLDALYTPARPETRLLARPGEKMVLDIPMVASGGFDGRIVTPGGGEISPLRGLRLLLEDEQGRTAGTTTVEWDGAFVMEAVRPGRYTLRGDAEQLAEQRLAIDPAPMTIEFRGGAVPEWKEGLRFRIVPAPPAEPGGAPSPVPGR
ncbi:MAG: hypothetical protein HY423_16705 [Candidatus Lambdaproteobacteria bacterium]|nr:hypothetical protein [Candidatus Lambdaproteobacteria bacterium]